MSTIELNQNVISRHGVSSKMRELTMSEVEVVSGGLTPDEGGVALLGVAFFAGPVTLGFVALGLGIGLMIGPHIPYNLR